MMTGKQKRLLLLAGIVDTIFANYEPHEKTRLHKELELRVSRGIRRLKKVHSKEEILQVVRTDCSKVWSDAVNHFAQKKVLIEASSCISQIQGKDEKGFSKYFGLSEKKIADWAKVYHGKDARELETNSREVAGYVYMEASKLYGLEVESEETKLSKYLQGRCHGKQQKG